MHEHLADWFREPLPMLYDKRWGEVHFFCSKLSKKYTVIRMQWDERKFNRGRDDPDAGGNQGSAAFNPANVSQVLQDPMFEGYMQLVLEVNSALEELAAWVERCPCHQRIQQK